MSGNKSMLYATSMMVVFVLLAVLCLAVLSCKGSNSQKSCNQEVNSQAGCCQTDSVKEGSSDLQLLSEANDAAYDSIAFKIWKLLSKDLRNYESPEGSTLKYYSGNLSEAEGYMIEEAVFCYPRKDGSFFVALEHIEAAESQGGEYEYTFFLYSNGLLSKTENNLPVPSIRQMLKSPEHYPGQESIVSRLDSLYNSRPRDFLKYMFYPEERMMYLQLSPLSYGADVEPDSFGHCNWLEQFWEMAADYTDNAYKWDGESFVKS